MTDLEQFCKGKKFEVPSDSTATTQKSDQKPKFSDEFLEKVHEQLIEFVQEKLGEARIRKHKGIQSYHIATFKTIPMRTKNEIYKSKDGVKDKRLKSRINEFFNMPTFSVGDEFITLDDAIYVQNSKGINGYEVVKTVCNQSGMGNPLFKAQQFNEERKKFIESQSKVYELHCHFSIYAQPAPSSKPEKEESIEKEDDVEGDDI
jgi:hypothetical protein